MSFRRRLIAATPLISLVLFFTIGFVFEKFEYAWLSFFLILLMPVLVGYKRIQLSFTLIITVIYIAIGFAFDAWHPGWILFLLIPIFHILFPYNIKTKKKIIREKNFFSEDGFINIDDDEDDE